MKIKYKLLSLAITFLIVSSTLTGCTGKLIEYGNDFPGYYKSTFKGFWGTEIKDISTDKGETIRLKYYTKIQKGSFSAKILDPNNKLVKKIKNGTAGKIKINAIKDGKYKLRIHGNSASGKFKFVWKVK